MSIGIPYNPESATSRAAAESVKDCASGMRARVFRAIMDSPGGLTCDDVEVVTGLRHQSASARCAELAKSNAICKTGSTRPTRSGRMADVYVATGCEYTPEPRDKAKKDTDARLVEESEWIACELLKLLPESRPLDRAIVQNYIDRVKARR